MLPNNYRFTLTRDIDTFEVHPYNFNNCSFPYTKNEGQYFFTKEFQGELIFKGSDYDYIKARYDQCYYCDVFELLIEKNMSGILAPPSYWVQWTGYFSMTDGKFDFELCEYRVKPIVEDNYSCLKRNGDKKINILNVASTTVTCGYSSWIEIEVGYYANVACGDPNQHFLKMSFLDTFYYDPYGCIHVYAREAIIVPNGYVMDVGQGWVIWTDADLIYLPISNIALLKSQDAPDGYKKWVRESSYTLTYTLGDIIMEKNFGGWPGDKQGYNYMGKLPPYWAYIYFKKTFYDYSLTGLYIDYIVRPLLDCIIYVIGEICFDVSIISEFFTNSTNPITGIASRVDHLMLAQKSDIKRFNASNPAAVVTGSDIGMVSFNELMNALYVIFQVVWFIDGSGDLNLIHISEIPHNVGLDLTSVSYLSTTEHNKIIEFNSDLLFRYEKWEFMEANSQDFMGLPIEYDELCSAKRNENTRSYFQSIITTDLKYIQQQPDKIADEGFVLLSTTGGVVHHSIGKLSGQDLYNNDLSIANLHYDYWRHNRILPTGLMNGILETFITVQKIRKLTEHTIIYDGIDPNNFEPMEEITTELGTAQVDSAEYLPFDNTLKLNLSI